jgi:hypothetical protein
MTNHIVGDVFENETTVNTTASLNVDVTADWSTGGAGSEITARFCTIEIIDATPIVETA